MTTRSLILNSTTGQRGFRGHRPWTSSHGTIFSKAKKGYYVYTGLISHFHGGYASLANVFIYFSDGW